MPMTVYQTATSGEYLHPLRLDDGDRDPLDPAAYLIPGGCTADPPPEVGVGEVAVLRNGAWEVVADHRGEAVYIDGVRVVISDFGPLPEGASVEPPPPTPDEMMQALRAERDARLATALAILDRHRNQVDFGLPATLTIAQATAWAVYAQALRDLPEHTADPASPEWPDVLGEDAV